jgi:hypothetical protein
MVTLNLASLAFVCLAMALPLLATRHERHRWGGMPPADVNA